jgi:hypothetical protein
MHCWTRRWSCLAMGLLLMFGSACNSSSTGKAGDEGSGSAASDTHIDVMCIGDRINDPKEPFHYSYKYSGDSGSFENEADITLQAMNITTKDQSGSHSYHGVRSDETSWGSAVLALSDLKMTVMSARLDSLNGTSSIRSQGSDPTNGYATTKYAIDTGNANAADQKQYLELFGKGSFEKGTVWVPADGCAVKLVLDEGIWQQDGSIKKAHFEIARIKK